MNARIGIASSTGRGVSGRRALAVVGTVASVAVLLVGAVVTVSRASAAWDRATETGKPGLLVLDTNEETPLIGSLAPGESAQWLVAAKLVSQPRGSLAIELRGNGKLVEPGGLVASVAGCDKDFLIVNGSPDCSSRIETLLPETPLSDLTAEGTRFPLKNILQNNPRELLVTITLPEEAQVNSGDDEWTEVGLGVHATGDTPAPPPGGPPGRIPTTGADGVALVLLAAGLIGVGVCTAYWRRRALAMSGSGGTRRCRAEGGGGSA